MRGFAQPFCVAPTVTLTLDGLRPEKLKLASGPFNLMYNLGGAIGIEVCGTILNDRANLHLLRPAERLTPANAAMAEIKRKIAAHNTALFGDAAHAQAAALRLLRFVTWGEAQR